MRDHYKATGKFTRIVGFPLYLEEYGLDDEKFHIVTAYASTNDNMGIVRRGGILFLDDDIAEVRKPGKFRLRLDYNNYPGCLIDALREYATLREKQYVALDTNHSRKNWQFLDKEMVVVKPRLFVRINEPNDELILPFQPGSGVRPELTLV
jgi:hypothetical protein